MTEAEECNLHLQSKVEVNPEHLSSALLCKLALELHQEMVLFWLLQTFPCDHI